MKVLGELPCGKGPKAPDTRLGEALQLTPWPPEPLNSRLLLPRFKAK